MLQIVRRPGGAICLMVLLAAVRVLPAQAGADYYIMNAPLDLYMGGSVSDVALPAEYGRTLAAYRSGNYRLAILELRTLIDIGLPDGRMDTYLFLTGECYHQLQLDKFAARQYRQLLDEYPESPHLPRAAFRLAEDAYGRSDDAGVKLYTDLLTGRYPDDPMTHAAIFIDGKRLYKKNAFADADRVLARVHKDGVMAAPATFVRSLCALQGNNFEQALLQLDAVTRNTKDPALRDEAVVLQADIYYRLKREDRAIALLKEVKPVSPRYDRAVLLLAQFYLARGQFEQAGRMGELLLELDNGAFMFEAAMVLESVYLKNRQDRKIDTLRMFLETAVRRKKIVFDLYRELDILTDLSAGFTFFCQRAAEKTVALADRRKVTSIHDEYTGLLNDLKQRNTRLLATLDLDGYVVGSSGIYELRFLEQLDREAAVLSARADTLSASIALAAAKTGARDTLSERRILEERGAVLGKIRALKELQTDIRTYCLTENAWMSSTEDVQAKFVDWNMMHMDEIKNRLREVYREIARLKSGEPAAASAPEPVPEAAPRQEGAVP